MDNAFEGTTKGIGINRAWRRRSIMDEPKIGTIDLDEKGRLKTFTPRDCKAMAYRAKNMGDEYYRLAFSEPSVISYPKEDIEATRVALMGLASEIYLKSIIYDKVMPSQKKGERGIIREHNLSKLFQMLPATVKKAILLRADIIEGYTDIEFISLLTDVGNAFINQRYCFELFSIELMYTSMRNITTSLKDVADRYWCESDLRQWKLSLYEKELRRISSSRKTCDDESM